VLNLDSLPGKMAIVGGGYIALEFAGIYNNFGTEVHVLWRQARPGPGRAGDWESCRVSSHHGRVHAARRPPRCCCLHALMMQGCSGLVACAAGTAGVTPPALP
jgi:hypothetical protein